MPVVRDGKRSPVRTHRDQLFRIGFFVTHCPRWAVCMDGGASPNSPPGSGSQSWLFCLLISFALAVAERERDVPLYSTGSRSPLPDVQRDFWNSQAAQINQLHSDHFQSLKHDSEVARSLQSGWSGGQHLPANVQEMCSPPHIMSVLYTWLSAQCSCFDLDAGGVSVVRNPSDHESSRVERPSVSHASVGGGLPPALSPQMHQSPTYQFLHLPRYPARS